MTIKEDMAELRKEFASLEEALKNEDEARRLQKEQTRPVFMRLPKSLVEQIDRKAEEEGRNRQNYIMKVLKEALV
ncbi:MAG: hypothetical protein KGH60_00110 [Candidatus Micrarchaeota archaeon]|nr:hypothetical protein [Candidatus Micrarchaeota archaeon]